MSLESTTVAIARSRPGLVFSEPLKILGQGNFGQCVAAHQLTDYKEKAVAIKISNASQKSYLMLRNESLVHSRLSHDNVIGFIGAGLATDGNKSDFSYLILEFATKGSLQSWFNRMERPFARLKIIYMIFRGLEYIHSRAIFHRDVKPDNVLVSVDSTGQLVVQLADFGLAEEEPWSRNRHGTILYFPPELWEPNPPYHNASVDVYSAALIFLQMLDPGYNLPWVDYASHAAWLRTNSIETLGIKSDVREFMRRALSTNKQRDSAGSLGARLYEVIAMKMAAKQEKLLRQRLDAAGASGSAPTRDNRE